MSYIGKLTAVVLPGLDGTGRLLAAFIDRLAQRRPVKLVAYAPDDPRDHDQLVPVVEEQLPAEPIVLIAESFSGPIAIEIAARRPNVARLVLASSFASHPLPQVLAPFSPLADPAWAPDLAITFALLGAAGTSELRRRVVEVVRGLPRETLRRRVTSAMSVDKQRRLQDITCPLLLLQGRHDLLLGTGHARSIAASHPDCRIDWFDAPHMLLETHPEATTRAIDTFCAD